MSMQRPKEVEEAIEYIANETSPDVFDTLLNYIQSLETKGQCLNEILEYMNDDSVSWRDISDDIINNILKEYNLK